MAYGTGAYYTQLAFGAQTANRTITFPNSSGTVALTNSILTNVVYNGYIKQNIGVGYTAGDYSVGMGLNNTATKSYAVAIGYGNNSTAIGAIAIGKENNVSGSYGFSFGSNNTVSGDNGSTAIGSSNTVSGTDGCVAMGKNNTAKGYSTTVFGKNSYVAGDCSFVAGYNLSISGACVNQFIIGHYNNSSYTSSTGSGASTDSAFMIGNGTSASASNAFRVTWDGKVYAKGAYSASGADYAEYFEWEDSNPDNEDRRGYFVTFGNDSKIKEATSDDSYILGIVSAKPVIIGNVDDDEWNDKYLKDEFGNFIMEEYEEEYEEVEYEEIIDQETGETQAVEKPITKTRIVTHYKINSEYDESQTYTPRSQRPEWSPIGLLGVLVARDDGTCVIGGYCKPSDDGIATSATTEDYNSSKNVYKVLERVNDNLIKIFFK